MQLHCIFYEVNLHQALFGAGECLQFLKIVLVSRVSASIFFKAVSLFSLLRSVPLATIFSFLEYGFTIRFKVLYLISLWFGVLVCWWLYELQHSFYLKPIILKLCFLCWLLFWGILSNHMEFLFLKYLYVTLSFLAIM